MSVQGNDTERLLEATDFEPLLGREARFGNERFPLVLREVDRLRQAPGAPTRAPFSLIFSGPKGDSYLMEGIYRCNFDDGPSFEFHLAPIHTPAADRQDYEAVFS